MTTLVYSFIFISDLFLSNNVGCIQTSGQVVGDINQGYNKCHLFFKSGTNQRLQWCRQTFNMVAVIVIIWFLVGGTSGTSREGRGLWDNLPGANPVSSKSVPDIKTDKSDKSFWTMLGTSRGPQYPSSYAPEESENPSYTPQEAQFRAPESVHHQPYQSLYAPAGTDSLSHSSYAPELSSPPRYPDPPELSSPPRNPDDLKEHKISKSTRENVSSFLRRIKSPNHDGTNRHIADLNTRADWRERAGQDGEVAAESKIDHVLKINRFNSY